MINKYINLVLVLILPVFFCGCANQYMQGNGAGQEFYGAFRSVDFSHCDIQLFNTKTNQRCAGVLYLDNSKKAVKDEDKKKWSDAHANLSCSDGALLDINLRAHSLSEWQGEGYDQHNRKYEFHVISKKAYKKIDNSHKITAKSYEQLIKELVKY